MKRNVSLYVALALLISVVPGLAPKAWSAPKARFGALTVDNTVYDVKSFSDALTDDAVQLALDNTPASNFVLRVPGGVYAFDREVLGLGKDNVTIEGAGKGRTVFDASALSNVPERTDLGFTRSRGILTMNPMNASAGTSTPRTGLTIKGITFKLGTGNPGDVYQKMVYFADYSNVTFEDVEFIGGYYEASYSESPTDHWMDGIRYVNCTFKDIGQNAINPNTPYIRNVSIRHSLFDNIVLGINLLGYGVDISHNTFRRVKSRGIMIGDSTAAFDIYGSYSVTHNKFIDLGYGADVGASVFGIHASSTDTVFEKPPLVAWNTWDNTTPPSGGSVTGIYSQGNVRADYNTFGAVTDNANTSTAIWLSQFATTHRIRWDLTGNVILDNNAGEHGWTYGVSATGNDNVELHMGGNRFRGIAYNKTGLYLVAVGGVYPFYSLNGDTIRGQIYMHDRNTAYTLNYPDREFDNTALYGDSQNGFRTTTVPDLRPVTAAVLTDNSATPSIRGGSVWYANNSGATTITNLLNPLPGQLVTIICLESNTTIADGAPLYTAGAFTCSPEDTITLHYGYNGRWREVDRSVN